MISKEKTKNTSTGISGKVLIPVDFSHKGSLAIEIGFELAKRLNKDVELLHASVIANPTIFPQFPDDFNGMDNENAEIEEVELEEEVHSIDSRSMLKLKNSIKGRQMAGEIPSVKFDTVLTPGMPEEVIAEYCAMTPPSIVVMATRGCEKRKEELVGSVTAEVIDHSLAPVITIPEDYSLSKFNEIERICAFCNFDNGDCEAIEAMMKLLGNPSLKIYLFPATDKFKLEVTNQKLTEISNSLATSFSNARFQAVTVKNEKNLREEAEAFFVDESIQMILAPNRKRNAIARFFNPGLAHKILYEIDFPMLAIPVQKD